MDDTAVVGSIAPAAPQDAPAPEQKELPITVKQREIFVLLEQAIAELQNRRAIVFATFLAGHDLDNAQFAGWGDGTMIVSLPK